MYFSAAGSRPYLVRVGVRVGVRVRVRVRAKDGVRVRPAVLCGHLAAGRESVSGRRVILVRVRVGVGVGVGLVRVGLGLGLGPTLTFIAAQ